MDIPYPSQHTMSSNHQPASEMPFKCFRFCIAKKEERKAGKRCEGGVDDRLESPVETHLFFVVLFLNVLLLFLYGSGGGGGGGVDC